MTPRLRALSPAVMEKAVSVWKRELANGLTPEGALMIVLSEVMPVHAHELAEKIRQHWYPRFPGKADYTQGMDAGYDRAADLIDPEMSGNGE